MNKKRTKKHPNEKAMQGEENLQEQQVSIGLIELNRLKAKEQEAAQYLEQVKRTQADYENARKRLEREKADFILFANEELMKQLLPIVDDFDRAFKQGDHPQADQAFVEGVRVIKNKFEDVLKGMGLKRIEESTGKTFDANIHQAVAHVPSDTHAENIVIEEVQKGWLFGDRLLRPAYVAVSSGAIERQEIDVPENPDQDSDKSDKTDKE